MADQILSPISLNNKDIAFLKAAIRLGKNHIGRAFPNPSVGTILTQDDEKGPVVISRGVTAKSGRPHGEVLALKKAGELAKGATCYVSLEPCSHYGKTPPCVEALHKAGIKRVFIAMEDPDQRVSGKGSKFLKDHKIEVYDNGAIDDARQANIGHITRILEKRPFISLKLALSQNNMIGIEGEGMAPITGALSRRIVHGIRAKSDAILVGIGTILADDPDLTCRLPGMADWSPKRFILDTHAKTPLSAKLFDKIDEITVTIVVGEDAPEEKVKQLKEKGAEIIVMPYRDNKLDLSELCKTMGEEGITYLMVEGGCTVAASFLQENLVDRAFIFKGDKDLIGKTIPVLPDNKGLEDELMKNNLQMTDSKNYENDILQCWERC